jgi:hypothetical protein
MTIPRLDLTTTDIREAVLRLDGIRLPQRTLATWLAKGFVSASIRYTGKRGPANAAVFNLTDLARVRLLMTLRRKYSLRMGLAIDVVNRIDAEMLRAPSARTIAVEIYGWHRVRVSTPGKVQQLELLPGRQQILLPLDDAIVGNEKVARAIVKARMAG